MHLCMYIQLAVCLYVYCTHGRHLASCKHAFTLFVVPTHVVQVTSSLKFVLLESVCLVQPFDFTVPHCVHL